MKNNYKFYFFLLAMPVIAVVFLSNSAGQVSPYSGSPGDGNSCALCHSGSSNHSAVAAITTNIPDEGYLYNEDYTITVSVTSDVSKHGFQATAEKSDNSKVGYFTAGTGSQTNHPSHSLVTHTAAGNSLTEWTFTWTSPATSEGDITFYAAVNATNSNDASTGDQVVLANTTVFANTTGVAAVAKIDFSVFPNPTTDYLQLSLSDEYDNVAYSITDYQGKQIQEGQLQHTNTVAVSSLTSGVYFIKLVSADKMGVVRFVKE